MRRPSPETPRVSGRRRLADCGRTATVCHLGRPGRPTEPGEGGSCSPRRSQAPSHARTRRRNIAQCLLTPTKSCIPPRVDRHTPPGAPVCGLRWGLGAPTSHGRPCAIHHMRTPASLPFPTPPPRTNTASRRPGFARRFRSMIRFVRGGDSVRADRLPIPSSIQGGDHVQTRDYRCARCGRLRVVLAVPAMAFNGYRGDYTTSDYCSICHQEVSRAPRPVYDRWAETKHAEAGADDQGARLPYGSSLRRLPHVELRPVEGRPDADGTATTPSPTADGDVVSGAPSTGIPIPASGRRQRRLLGELRRLLVVPLRRDHRQRSAVRQRRQRHGAQRCRYGNLANAEICGQCHSRYSYTATPTTCSDGAVRQAPTAPARRSSNPSPTSLLQPQFAIGYPMLGTPG